MGCWPSGDDFLFFLIHFCNLILILMMSYMFQAYGHKILTGRRSKMHSIRKTSGLAGFPKRDESEYDAFGVGHSSTSISAGLGMYVV